MNADFIIAFRESVAAFCGNAGFLFSAIERGFLNPYERDSMLPGLRKYSAKLHDSIEAVDVLIRPAAGTNPGEWTSDLLLLTEAIRYDLHTLLASNTCDPIEMWSDAEAHLRPILERTRQNLCKLQTKVRFLDNLDLLAVIQNTRQFIAQTQHNDPPDALPTKPTADDSVVVAAKTLCDQAKEPSVTLEVDIPTQRATLKTPKGEESFDLPSEGVARWLKVLADHPDEWIRPDDWEIHGGVDLQGVRSGDKLRSLDAKCPKLGRLIATSKHDGTRFEPAWALKPGSAPRCATNR
jgi:hypothetical protein